MLNICNKAVLLLESKENFRVLAVQELRILETTCDIAVLLHSKKFP
jgi:hypothetical protein